MNTWVYIDGFNLYYGALRRTPHKWLDPAKAIRAHLQSRNIIGRVECFTARLQPRPDNPDIATPADIAGHFTRANKNRITEILETLATLGQAARTGDRPIFTSR